MRLRRKPLQNALAEPIGRLAAAEGVGGTRHPWVTVERASQPQPPLPTLFDASLVFVGRGETRGIRGTAEFGGHPGQFLMLTSPMAMPREVLATPGRPMLSAVVRLDVAMLNDLLMELDAPPPRSREELGVFAAPLTEDVEDAALRLLTCLEAEPSAKILARQTIRELLYRVLQGPRGNALWALSLADRPSAHLVQVIRHMNAHFQDDLSIPRLAEMAHMSVATFHHHFRAATATSPLQYLKTVRLTRARTLILRDGLRASAAAAAVGYESPSQFSREYRRLFGSTPLEQSPLRRRIATPTR